MEALSPTQLEQISGIAILALVALAVITDKLVWHTRLKKAQERADRWEQVAIEALRAGATAGVRAAETAVDVVSSLPDPNRRSTQQGEPHS